MVCDQYDKLIYILLLLRTYQKDKRLKILDEFVNKDENFKNRYYLSNYRKLGHSTNKREMNVSVSYLKNIGSRESIALLCIRVKSASVGK